MNKIIVNGPCRLEGEVTISGAKNAAVAILPATLLVNGKCHLENVPNISDIDALNEILEYLGAGVKREGETIKIDSKTYYDLKERSLDLLDDTKIMRR